MLKRVLKALFLAWIAKRFAGRRAAPAGRPYRR